MNDKKTCLENLFSKSDDERIKDGKISGANNGLQVVVGRLVTFTEDGGIRVASDEEEKVFERMSAVFHIDELVEVPG